MVWRVIEIQRAMKYTAIHLILWHVIYIDSIPNDESTQSTLWFDLKCFEEMETKVHISASNFEMNAIILMKYTYIRQEHF